MNSLKQVKTLAPETNQIELLFERIALSDDQLAFAQFFRLLYKPLMAACLPLIGSVELAEEIVSDVFCAIWKNRKTIQVHTSIKAYLFTSIRNRAFDYLRKLKREKSTDLEHAHGIASPEESQEDLMETRVLTERVESAINSLPPQCRTIFLLNREKGLKYREIAEQLSISIKTVETHMGRALKHLRTQLL
ncbi:MAG: RNA polymerase sigma-70 factor [Cyclobacteriaceae bacterium]|nr:RNA polymerase sigma-70 factor [Cyclobacteriaceae bacterium]UYN85482.1 MAG: RNA polymerase sigma-70 factor [Cyclobacteriaceae bacterium]